jgi:hypothetical protein
VAEQPQSIYPRSDELAEIAAERNVETIDVQDIIDYLGELEHGTADADDYFTPLASMLKDDIDMDEYRRAALDVVSAILNDMVLTVSFNEEDDDAGTDAQ